ncbi:Bro-N domain-containing protein [Corynebacterium diphtheriae]|uniref:BRO-N domain-containing protein n=1 Tax=Corynebacterium diphtheriae TaxID=1717 RepID=UPI0024557C11|nr:Bro-N domain-containing protein [Corynebacterium diphtheriae]
MSPLRSATLTAARRSKTIARGDPFRYPLETAGGIQQVRFITEGNLYRLIISSKLPAAQKFEAWVFATAIPTKHETSSTAKPTSANSSSRLRKPKDSTRTA